MRTHKGSNIMVTRKSAFETAARRPMETEAKGSDLQIVVLYATPEMTKEALHCAEALGHGLSLIVRLIDIEVVPYAYPLNRPPIDPEFAKRRLERIALEDGTSIKAEVLYARDRDEALVRRLCPGSLVLIPVRGFWGRVFQKRLKRNLMKHGHEVVLVPCK